MQNASVALILACSLLVLIADWSSLPLLRRNDG